MPECMNAELTAQLSRCLARIVRVPPPIPMGEWCEQHIVISRRQGTPFPGPFRMRPISPWVAGWFDWIQDPEINTFVLKKGAQVSATLTAYLAICYWLVEDPDPILLVMPTEPLAKSASRLRIQPLIEDSPIVAATLTGRDDDLQLLEYKTQRTYARLIGSNSPATLASFPHRFLVMDEVDKFKESVGKEGSVTALASQRTTQFWNSFQLEMSTPTTRAGYIEKGYQLGDQRMFFVPCTHCGRFQPLKWEQIKFNSKLSPAAAGAGAYYECDNRRCHAKLTEADKAEMVQHGEWKPTEKAKRPGYVSAHLPGYYSLAEKRSIRALVTKFLTVKDDPAELQDFKNSDCGELWEELPVQPVERRFIYEIRDRNRYRRARIPTALPVYVVLVADVQTAHIVWTVWAMAPHDLWLVDNGMSSVLEELPDIAKGPFKDETENAYAVHFQVLDSGHRTTEVYKYHLRTPRSIVIKGDTGATTRQTMPIRFQELDRFPDGRRLPPGRGIKLRHLHPTYFRDELIALIQPPDPEDTEFELAAQALRIHFHEEIDRDFVDQITGEIPLEGKADKYGNKPRYYKKIRDNDYFDCSHYALAVRWMMRRDLQRLEDQAATGPEEPTAEAPRAKAPPSAEHESSNVSYADEDEDEW